MKPAERLAGHPALAEAEIQRLRCLLLQRWQPIETAPKDGTEILLADDSRVTFGKWLAPSEKPRIIYRDGFAPEPEWDEFEPHWTSWDGGFTQEHPPTHWMPLPPPPRCEYCDDTGDVNSLDGEWRGTCSCPAGKNPAAL